MLLSVGQFSKAIEIMSNLREHRYLNFLFLQYCCDNNLIQVKNNDEVISKNTTNCVHKSLCDKIYADNAKVFYKLDNMDVFKSLCEQAGELGEKLLSNWFLILSSI